VSIEREVIGVPRPGNGQPELARELCEHIVGSSAQILNGR